MKTKIILGIVALLIFSIGLVTMSSNMGFKLSMATPASGIAKYIGLPYFPSYTTLTAAFLYNDLVAAGGGTVTVSNFNGTAWQNYNGAGANFTLVPGISYKIATSNALTNWVIVGSHDPNATIAIPASGIAKYVAPPYHTTCTNAATLYNELVAAGGGTVTVSNFNGTAWQNYNGAGANFALAPGIGYKAACSNAITWTPSHY